MSQEVLVDLDVYGRNNDQGQALVHKQDYAISNSIVFYLTSEKGDYLYNSTEGGLLRRLLWKNINSTTIQKEQRNLNRILQERFGVYVSSIEVSLEPDFEARLIEVNVYWVSLQSGDTNDIQFFVQLPGNTAIQPLVENSGKKIGILAEGDNLVAFVELELPNRPNDMLVFNSDTNRYDWGPYTFMNLTSNSPELPTIQALIQS